MRPSSASRAPDEEASECSRDRCPATCRGLGGGGERLLLDDGPRAPADALVVVDDAVQVRDVVHSAGQNLHTRYLLLRGGSRDCDPQLLETNVNLFDSIPLPGISTNSFWS